MRLDPAKLSAPRPPPGCAAQPGLVARLEAGRARPLTVLEAPDGAGKTTLLAQWLEDLPVAAAWLSLEPLDDHPARFGAYLAGAVATALGRDPEVEALLGRDGPVDLEVLLAAEAVIPLLDAAAEAVLVLDDLHHLCAPAIHGALAWLLGHAPPGLHVVLSSAAPLPAPLAGLDAHRLGAADLHAPPPNLAALAPLAPAAILERLCPALLDPLGCPGASLTDLAAAGLVRSLDPHREWFELPTAARAALSAGLDGAADLHRRAADALLARGATAEAVHHLGRSRQPSTHPHQRWVEALLGRRDRRAARAWLDLAPADEPWAAIGSAALALAERNEARAERILRRAPRADDDAGRRLLSGLRALTALAFGDPGDAEAAMDEAPYPPPALEWLITARIARLDDRPDVALAYARDAAKTDPVPALPDLDLDARALEAELLEAQGDLEGAALALDAIEAALSDRRLRFTTRASDLYEARARHAEARGQPAAPHLEQAAQIREALALPAPEAPAGPSPDLDLPARERKTLAALRKAAGAAGLAAHLRVSPGTARLRLYDLLAAAGVDTRYALL